MAEVQTIVATGKRKTAIARVRMQPGTGAVRVNGRAVSEYFTREALLISIHEPFEAAAVQERYDIFATIRGGGATGQADALRHGISRAIEKADATLRAPLKRKGMLRRDSRKKERKKYGQKGARARYQFSKR